MNPLFVFYIRNMLILKGKCGNNGVVHFVELMYTKSEDRG